MYESFLGIVCCRCVSPHRRSLRRCASNLMSMEQHKSFYKEKTKFNIPGKEAHILFWAARTFAADLNIRRAVDLSGVAASPGGEGHRLYMMNNFPIKRLAGAAAAQVLVAWLEFGGLRWRSSLDLLKQGGFPRVFSFRSFGFGRASS